MCNRLQQYNIHQSVPQQFAQPQLLFTQNISPFLIGLNSTANRPSRLTQCCTQFKSPGVKILCVLYLHDNVAFTFK